MPLPRIRPLRHCAARPVEELGNRRRGGFGAVRMVYAPLVQPWYVPALRWHVAVLAAGFAALAIVCGSPAIVVLLAPLAAPAIAIRGARRRYWWEGQPVQVPSDLGAPPQRIGDDVACTACDAVVPFATMTVAEDGYFCPGCARARAT